MNYETTFGLILDLGREMIRCGGETHRVEDTLYRLAAGYDFRDCNIWVVPTEIQATFTDPDGVIRTQIRHVRGSSLNFDALDRLNALSRWACVQQPEPEFFSARLNEIQKAAPLKDGWPILAAYWVAGALPCSSAVIWWIRLLRRWPRF